MIPGFNHNVQHNGRTYHIQTEDSGIENPHIITLLYVNGTIIAKKKTSYLDLVKSEKLAQLVRELMEEQHKSMLRELVRGGYEAESQKIPRGPNEPQTPAESSAPPAAGPPQSNPPAAAAPANVKISQSKSESLASLFGGASGEEGEKSLDEIILSYLGDP